MQVQLTHPSLRMLLLLPWLEHYLVLRFLDLTLALRDRMLDMSSSIGAVSWLLIFER